MTNDISNGMKCPNCGEDDIHIASGGCASCAGCGTAWVVCECGGVLEPLRGFRNVSECGFCDRVYVGGAKGYRIFWKRKEAGE